MHQSGAYREGYLTDEAIYSFRTQI